MNRDRGLPWGRPEKKNDLFASLKGSIFYCPFAFNRRRLMLPGNKKTTAGNRRWSFFSCRGEKTRTSGPYVPNVVRYQLRYTPIQLQSPPAGGEEALLNKIQVRKNNKIFVLKELFNYFSIYTMLLKIFYLLMINAYVEHRFWIFNRFDVGENSRRRTGEQHTDILFHFLCQSVSLMKIPFSRHLQLD